MSASPVDTGIAAGLAGRGHDANDQARPQRVVGVDNLKALLVAWIIFCHAILGYTAIGGWPYDEVNETTIRPAVELPLLVALGPSALFVIGVFFFLAGLFAPAELRRTTRAGYAATRLVRLGVPWVAFLLVVWPLCMWCAYRAAGNPLTLADAFRQRQPFLDSGPLWFVQVLLYVSLGYAVAGDRRSRRRRVSDHPRWLLIGAVSLIALLSFGVRLWFPARSQQILDLHLWQWPQCVVMFGLGVILAGQGWVRCVPRSAVWVGGWAVLAVVLAMPAVAVSTRLTNVAVDGAPFLGGWHWQSAVLVMLEAVLVVAGSVVLLGLGQRWLTSVARIPAACARAAYAAFVLQAPVLIGLAIVMRPLPLPALAKAVLVGTLAVAASFWLAWLVVTRTAVRRLL